METIQREEETTITIPPIGTNTSLLIDNMGFHQHIVLGIAIIVAFVNAQGMTQKNVVIYLVSLGPMASKLRQVHQELHHQLMSRLLTALNHNSESLTQELLIISPMIQPI
ncbi:hypothetical protein AgCh_000402 [Apium graveolens]